MDDALALTVSDLRVRGDDGRAILTVPHLAVPQGAAIGIRGPSGAGKSTLLFALAGLASRASGRVAWGTTDIVAMGEGDRAAFRRDRIGMIFQDFLLFEELGALANASLAASFAPRRRRGAIARQAGATLARLGLTGGSRAVASFSGGERQRVAVARALSTDPAIILADEPTASLDRETADRLVDDLVALARETGKTLIAVSHDPAVHRRMDRLVDVVDGTLAAEAPADA
ncbi:MAG: ATP-binding cassette domain-containing protein [Bauldia litoralis]|uniref:ABC transporter ATP-binding protein n=1 Tax=Bauldia litoralis TaxID=665467 RepID=UPI003299FD8B